MKLKLAAPGPGALTFAVGDVVRCTETFGLEPDGPIMKGHIYQVRALEGDATAPAALRFPLVHLHGVEGGYGAFRFTMVSPAAAPAAADDVAARMAQVMRERVCETGCCDAQDLARAGFTSIEITAHAAAARRLAGAPTTQVAA